MNTKVKVTADKNGNIIGVFKNNPEYGYIRVEQNNVPIISDLGWLKISKRSAFIKGKIEDLQACNYAEGQELPGKIVVIESLTPFNMENPDTNLKLAGNTGIICRVDDQPIYRQSFYTKNPNVEDELIHHTNTDEIRQMQMEQQALMRSVKESTVEFN